MSPSHEKKALESAFTEAYQSLNTAQKQAVDTIEGPVMVIAGPGTGKTQILTLRIANILRQTDVGSSSILALTFTESGAKAMRLRLANYLGAQAYQVPMHTFHGFAETLIRDYPEAYERIVGGKPATDIEKITIIENILDTAGIKKLRPIGDPAYYIQPIIRMIGELKKEYITPDKLALIIADQEAELMSIEKIHQKGAHKGKVRGDYTKKEQIIIKNRELLLVYRQYQSSLTAAKLYDFEDMIVETVLALENNEDMLRDLQEQYQYILADEHQDVNGSQNKILELLASYHESPNIFVVGDEKQAIYRFQGASLENFLYFQEHFTGTTVISLTENYRSGQVILDSAHSLVATEDPLLAKLRVPLRAEAVRDSKVTTQNFSHMAVEDDWLVHSVKDNVEAGVPCEEIVVIVRTNKEVETIAARLRQAGLSVSAYASGDMMTHPITQTVEALLAAVLTETKETALFAVLHGAYWGLSLADIIKISGARSYDNSLASILTSTDKLKELGVTKIDEALKIMTVLETARSMSVSEPPHRVLQYLLTESGLLTHLVKDNPIEGTRVIRRLYDEVESLVMNDGLSTLEKVCEMFSTRRAHNIALNAPYIETNNESVKVMTAHRSKGLEFSVVYIPHLQDNNWGGSGGRTSFTIPLTSVTVDSGTKLDDEQRLLYVAMTRAKHQLHLSYSASNTAGKTLIPSRFIESLDETTLSTIDTTAFSQDFDPVAALNLSNKLPAIDPGLLLTALTGRGFSATSLNNFLKNPWDYLYRNVLRVPEVQPAHMQFGTAIHSVLEYATKTFSTTGKFPSDTLIKQKIETALGRLPISTNEFVRLLDRSLTVVYPYLAQLEKTNLVKTKEELNVKVLLTTGIPALPQLLLTGKIDRIDLDEGGQAIVVVDYKTGKPKSRNFIEGNTAGSNGSYKRQLVFYALLLKLYNDDRYLTNVGTLSFVEPDAKGVIHEETFVITDTEIEELKNEIIGAVRDIISGDFLQNSTLAKESSYAHFISILS